MQLHPTDILGGVFFLLGAMSGYVVTPPSFLRKNYC